jgi:hypothetical protein
MFVGVVWSETISFVEDWRVVNRASAEAANPCETDTESLIAQRNGGVAEGLSVDGFVTL